MIGRDIGKFILSWLLWPIWAALLVWYILRAICRAIRDCWQYAATLRRFEKIVKGWTWEQEQDLGRGGQPWRG